MQDKHCTPPKDPQTPVEAPQDQHHDLRVACGPSRCDDPALTECQYKAIYKRMKNRPSITGNFSASLPQERHDPPCKKKGRHRGGRRGRGGGG